MRFRWQWIRAVGLCASFALVAGCADGNSTPMLGADAGSCEDLCTPGDRICAPGGYQQCGDFDSDTCVEWSPTMSCASDESCMDGECVPGSGCVDECMAGSVRCTADGGAVEACEMDAITGCLAWAEPADCPSDETCSAGRCTDPSECTDECAEGSRQCADDGFQTCEDSDADPCLEWGEVTSCPPDETCSDGSCSGSCTNECTEGATKCATGGDGFRSCGNTDADSCLEWGTIEPCPDGETCSSGICSTSCTDECSTGDTRCNSSGTGVEECGNHDSDECLEYGPTVDCDTDAGETCEVNDAGDAACVASCDCDFFSGICEPESNPSTMACPCDPDCDGGASPCGDDGHCDTWCPAGEDPDCGCGCDFNAYCEAESSGTTTTCSCDPSCDPNERACADDAHCDTFCPEGTDPDCGRTEPCEDRWINIGLLFANQMTLSGEFENPDSVEGEPWVFLSHVSLATGSAEMVVKMAENELSCVEQIRIEGFGYDSGAGSGCTNLGAGEGEVYIYNYRTSAYELLPNPIDGGDSITRVTNTVTSGVSDYLRCPSADPYCYVRVKAEGSGLDCFHLNSMNVQVFLSP